MRLHPPAHAPARLFGGAPAPTPVGGPPAFSDFSDAAWAVSMLRLIRDSEKKQPVFYPEQAQLRAIFYILL